MADEDFGVNLMRAIAAQAHFQSCVLAGREMFGKSYFSLGLAEKAAVDQAVLGHVGGMYRELTPEYLAGPMRQPAGFGIPKPDTTLPTAPGSSG